MPSDLEWRVDYMGREGAPIVTIDNFSADAPALVESVVTAPFFPVAGNLYPGRRRHAPESYANAMLQTLEPLVRSAFALTGAELLKVDSDFSLITTPPKSLALAQRIPHIDEPNLGKIAVLHYLFPPELGGTSFYRHRATGYETITADRHRQYGETLMRELEGNAPAGDFIRGDTVLFERIHNVEAAFNRLVIYRSASLHSGDVAPDCPFDANPRTGRLSINSFLYFRAPETTPVDPRALQGSF